MDHLLMPRSKNIPITSRNKEDKYCRCFVPKVGAEGISLQEIVQWNENQDECCQLEKELAHHMCDGFAVVFCFVRHAFAVYPRVAIL